MRRSDSGFLDDLLDILFRHDQPGTAYDPEFDQTEYAPEARTILQLVDRVRDEPEMQAVVRQAFESNGVLQQALEPRLTAAAHEIWSVWRRPIDRRLPPASGS